MQPVGAVPYNQHPVLYLCVTCCSCPKWFMSGRAQFDRPECARSMCCQIVFNGHAHISLEVEAEPCFDPVLVSIFLDFPLDSVSSPHEGDFLF